MRFTLFTFLALILLIWHQALALPGVLPPTPNTEVTVWNIPRAAPYDAATHQILDSRAVDIKPAADLDARSLRTRTPAWSSSEVKRRLVVAFSTGAATAIHLANAAITWKFGLVYNADTRGRETVIGTLYQDGDSSLANVEMCVRGVKSYQFGNINNQYWVDANVDLEGIYTDSVSGNVVTMFWTAAVRLAQDSSLNEVIDMVIPPMGFELVPQSAQSCLPMGGTSIEPTSWTFAGWS